MSKKAAVLLAEGFEPTEAVSPADVLKRAGVDVVIVSISDSLAVTGGPAVKIVADALLAHTNFDDFDMLILPGGNLGVENLAKSDTVAQVVTEFMNKGRGKGTEGPITAAICAGPTVLAGFGLLEGYKATCYPGCETAFPAGVYVDEPVVVSDNLITSQGPATALAFGKALATALVGEATANDVTSGMLM